MKKFSLLFFLLFMTLIVSGCFHQEEKEQIQTPTQTDNAMKQGQLPTPQINIKNITATTDNDTPVQMDVKILPLDQKPSDTAAYTGEILAGNASPFLNFNAADYQKALKENKQIMLYFYANWCPICKAEIQTTYQVFNELQNPNIIGFRVNYNDNETSDEERQLAREHGVAYQHTKVFIKNGARISKYPNSLSKEEYFDAIQKSFQ